MLTIVALELVVRVRMGRVASGYVMASFDRPGWILLIVLGSKLVDHR